MLLTAIKMECVVLLQSMSKLRKWLSENRYFNSFPLSILLYSRKMIYHYAQKMSQSLKLAQNNKLNKIVYWLLTKRVGLPIDYNTSVWCNKNFATMFMKAAKQKGTSRFKGQMTTTTETLDKMVSN